MKKQTYHAPEIKTVEFKVESGFQQSSLQARHGAGLSEFFNGGDQYTQQHYGRMTSSDGNGSTWGTFGSNNQ